MCIRPAPPPISNGEGAMEESSIRQQSSKDWVKVGPRPSAEASQRLPPRGLALSPAQAHGLEAERLSIDCILSSLGFKKKSGEAAPLQAAPLQPHFPSRHGAWHALQVSCPATSNRYRHGTGRVCSARAQPVAARSTM